MRQVTFKDIHKVGHIVHETQQLKHIHYPEMLSRYNSNFIEYKTWVAVEEFQQDLQYLREFHMKNDQKHVKFYFPADEEIPDQIKDVLTKYQFEIEKLELYTLEPNRFPPVEDHPDISVHQVTEENLEDFLSLQYQQDIPFGTNFAEQKIALYKSFFEDPIIVQLLAYYKGIPAGSVHLILSDATVEIDDFSVKADYQRKGIGTRLQKYVMEHFSDKTIILVAEGSDTPREMYQKQNYQCVGFRYEATKVYKSVKTPALTLF
ncbi:GNAT family N-acetyltransferase [Robertmurraya korlensis]|uniref:GNAT family N-acetyltransferase n=1 Tax=Robertmurraya korlensis TaxID=519977 RepID=UPI000824A3B5|nr:GNAT family N-acetyltransferase [Robertmurraya korlensis]